MPQRKCSCSYSREPSYYEYESKTINMKLINIDQLFFQDVENSNEQMTF